MTIRTPRIIAHRGYAARFPENTLESFSAAIAAGALFVELDVQLSADGVPMVVHDDSLARTANRPEKIRELDASQLETVDVGYTRRFGDEFPGVRMPRLAQVGELAREHPEVTWFVELKRQSAERFGVDRSVEAVLAEMDFPRAVLISFVEEAVALASGQGVPVGWAIRKWGRASEETARRLNPDYLFCNHRKLPDRAVLWQGPWQWAFYEITKPELASSLAARGAAFVETMAVAEMIHALDHWGSRDD